jgi:hypothetical protein
MAYRSSGRRRGGSRAASPGRTGRPNARPGDCRSCGVPVPAGAGELYRENGAWSVVHTQAKWSGSPVSGQYAGGCPAETDQMNTAGGFGGPDGAQPETARITAVAAAYAARNPGRAASGHTAYTSSGARMTDRFSRCVDAPCCGCCD